MRWRRREDPPEPLTAAQKAAALDLARATLAADHLAIERHAPLAVPREVPEDAEKAVRAQLSEDGNHG